MEQQKSIALVAHDNKKSELIDWVILQKERLLQCQLFATGTTGRLVEKELGKSIHKLQSGPLGGDQQLGALIAEQKIDMLVFFWDPLEPLPHDPDIKALLRIAVVWNVPIACNRSSADLMFSSELFFNGYERSVPDFQEHLGRSVPE